MSPENTVVPESPTAEVVLAPEVESVSTSESQAVEPVQSEPVSEVAVEPSSPVAQPTPTSESPAPEIPPESPKSVPVPPPVPTQAPSRTLRASSKNRMLEVVRARKAERLEKIVVLAREKQVIRNDDVEKLLKVTDTTVTNYLNALVLSARLRRSGHGRAATYEPV